MTYLLQWNIRGLNVNFSSGLQPLIHSLSPNILCLQETKLSTKEYTIKNYTEYHHINENNLIASGGTSIFVKNHLLQREINLHTSLQAKAVRVSSHKAITVCSVYLPPGDPTFTETTNGST